MPKININGVTREMTRGSQTFKVKPGSIAHTAGFGAIYEMSPSGAWTKIG